MTFTSLHTCLYTLRHVCSHLCAHTCDRRDKLRLYQVFAMHLSQAPSINCTMQCKHFLTQSKNGETEAESTEPCSSFFELSSPGLLFSLPDLSKTVQGRELRSEPDWAWPFGLLPPVSLRDPRRTPLALL